MKKPTIRRKPSRQVSDVKNLDDFLQGNASAKEENSSPKTEKRGRPKGAVPKGNFRQSVPLSILDTLSLHLETLPNPPSRNSWIVQAIIEKLDRDT